jgi:hypothetical protein
VLDKVSPFWFIILVLAVAAIAIVQVLSYTN